jgi:molecular chaperone HtpG
MIKSYANHGESSTLEDTIYLLFYQACIAEGEEIENMGDFTRKLNNLLCNIAM